MPELPDLLLYLERLEPLVVGKPLLKLRILSPFVLQSFQPSIRDIVGKKALSLRRMGKRIVWEFEGDLFLVFHLMIAGRFHLKRPGAAVSRKNTLAAFEFETGLLLLTEAGAKKRATLHLVRGKAALEPFDRGGLEVLDCSLADFRETLTRENHTVKRALADPNLFSGIGNAYSDEILHVARLSPVKLTKRLSAGEIEALHEAAKKTLVSWIERLRREAAGRFPEKVTAFHPGMAVHGRYGKPCPACGAGVQRIVYAENEANYCARCQTGGRLLADRALSRLFKRDWPKTLEDLEELRDGTARAEALRRPPTALRSAQRRKIENVRRSPRTPRRKDPESFGYR